MVMLLPIMLPSQAEIGAAAGTPHDLMVAVVSAFGAAAVIGLPFGLWHRRGLVGSLYRVGGAAVLVRLVFAAPLLLVMSAWMGAVVIAVLDGLFTVRGDLLTERRQGRWAGLGRRFGAGGVAGADRRTVGPAFSREPAYNPSPSWGPGSGTEAPPSSGGWTGYAPPPYGAGDQGQWWGAQGAAASGYAPPPPSAGAGTPPAWGATNPRRVRRGQTEVWRPARSGGRPVLAWIVALLAMLGVAAFALASHANLLPQNGLSLQLPSTQSSPPPTGQSQGPATTNQAPSNQAPSEDDESTAPTAGPKEVCYRSPVGSGSVCFQRHSRKG